MAPEEEPKEPPKDYAALIKGEEPACDAEEEESAPILEILKLIKMVGQP